MKQFLEWLVEAIFLMQQSGMDRTTALEKTKPDSCEPYQYEIACTLILFAFSDIIEWANLAGIDTSNIEKIKKTGNL